MPLMPKRVKYRKTSGEAARARLRVICASISANLDCRHWNAPGSPIRRLKLPESP